METHVDDRWESYADIHRRQERAAEVAEESRQVGRVGDLLEENRRLRAMLTAVVEATGEVRVGMKMFHALLGRAAGGPRLLVMEAPATGEIVLRVDGGKP
jgi:predicted RNA-binding Zn ribbon-like protein